MNRECVTCRHLGNCGTASPQTILSHFVCVFYEEVTKPEEVKARCDVINKFGEAGLQVLVSPPEEG